jgi:hypothetical protein
MPVLTVFRRSGIFLFIILASWNVAPASTYVVWRAGDYATYRNVLTGQEVRAEVDLEGRGRVHYTEFAGLGPLWVATSGRDEYIYLYTPPDRAFQLLVDALAPIGSSNPLHVPPCNNGVAVLAAREALTVPAGAFADVIRIDFTTSCADAGVTSAWFARGVGPIQWTASTIAGPVTYQMIAARIGGVRYPKHNGICLVSEFPGPVVWIDRMPPVPRPGSINVFLTIENNTPERLTYSFSTGQEFEIEIIDGGGNVVSRWSRGRAFTLAFHDVTLDPGTSHRFGGAVALAYDDGGALAQGYYTVKVYLTNINPRGVAPPSSATPIEIRWAF